MERFAGIPSKLSWVMYLIEINEHLRIRQPYDKAWSFFPAFYSFYSFLYRFQKCVWVVISIACRHYCGLASSGHRTNVIWSHFIDLATFAWWINASIISFSRRCRLWFLWSCTLHSVLWVQTVFLSASRYRSERVVDLLWWLAALFWGWFNYWPPNSSGSPSHIRQTFFLNEMTPLDCLFFLEWFLWQERS